MAKGSDKSTGTKAAKAASSVLRDGRTAEKSKTAAGSALSQVEPKKDAGKGKGAGKSKEK